MITKYKRLRGTGLVLSAMVFILAFTTGWLAINAYDSIQKQRQQVYLKKEILSKSNTISKIIDHRFALLYGIRAYIHTHLDYHDNTRSSLKNDNINVFLKEIYKTVPDIRSVTISPDGIHQYIYPVTESTKKTLGHNLLTDKRPQVRKKVQQTIEMKTIGLSGPYPLREDGTLGLIARLPVYQNDEFWGFTAMVLNVRQMLATCGIELDSGIAFRNKDGKLFFGDSGIFEDEPLLATVELPDGEWELGTMSVTSGLLPMDKVILFILNSFSALIISSLFFLVFTRHWYLRNEVKKAEEIILDSKLLLDAVFEQNYTPMWISDAEGTLIRANSALNEILNVSNKQIVGKFNILKDPSNVQSGLAERYRSVYEDGIPVEFETHWQPVYSEDNEWKDANRVYVEGTLFPLKNQNGKITNAVMSFRDVSEKKQLEAQLRQAQKMEAIGNLAGGIAHDFNNILSSIIGFTELALDDAVKGTPQEDDLQEVYTAGKRARDLVKQILAFARQSDEEKKPIQMETVAQEVLKLIRSTVPTTIEIKENLQSNSLIMGNQSQVHQLLMNLCTNAAQAMENLGGVLKIELIDVENGNKAPLSLSELKSGNYIKLTVSDTGPGISPDIIESIFEPYFTTKGVGEGTGMGLALVHGIVESYGGKITVESELGIGTVFSIYLPITKRHEDYQPYETEELPSGIERVLFVDDELPVAKMGSQILERLGYHVTVCTSSVEALELFRSNPGDFDLVISDMTMPNMTGDELAMEIIAFRSDIPIILCTGYSKKISEEAALKIGIKAYVYKPLVKSDMAKTIRKVLDEAKG